MIHFPAEGAPLWTEGLIVVLAVIGGAAGWSRTGVPGADSRVLRFLGFYTLLMLVLYSAIPYKTPWCLLGFLHGMILLAGTGAVFLVRASRGVAMTALVCALLATAAAHLGWQAFSGSFRFAADPRNPYVYAHTGTDVFEIVGRLKDLARAHPDGLSMPVQVISRENLWPLPWYLRGFSSVAWWNGVSEDGPERPGHRRDSGHGSGPGEEALRPAAPRRAGALREPLRAAGRAAPPGRAARVRGRGPSGTSFRRLEAAADSSSPGPTGSSE